MGVFGNPITDEILELLPQHQGKKIRAVDRARVALNWKNSEGKDARARQYAENLKATCGVHDIVTACLVYNATGDTVKYADKKDWNGTLAYPYPSMIENGQWGVFLHRQDTNSKFGSIGAVVYRGTNAENKACDWILAWKNPYDKSQHKNTAHTEVREINHSYDDDTWKRVRDSMKKFKLLDNSNCYGCLSSVEIGKDRYTHFRAVLTLENANENIR